MAGINIKGQRFGRLSAVEPVLVRELRRTRTYWRCRCDCGQEIVVRPHSLTTGHTQSCGCKKADDIIAQAERQITHGHTSRRRHAGKTSSKTYQIYRGMKRRCQDPSEERYKLHAGRGIYVCERWRESFENFLADMGEAPPRMSLDRIDNNGPYAPWNCRWATASQQQQNRRDNRFSEQDVRSIRQRLSTGARPTDLAREYNCERSHISRIGSGKLWRGLDA